MNHQFPYSANIVITNFYSDVETLKFRNFFIQKVTSKNREQVKQRLPGCKVSYGDYYIKRDYIETPQLYDQSGRWMIPYDSEDLMLLLRLFKPGK